MNLQTRAFRSFRGSGGDGTFIGSASSSSSGHLSFNQQQQHVVHHQQSPQSQIPAVVAPSPHSLSQQSQQQHQQLLSVEERNQVIFRKVRGILNKLTPEKFDKLGDQLISLGLDSVPVLKGVILLIFEKAIEEPKYSSMYAQLCKKLSRELNSIDNSTPPPPSSTTSTTSTTASGSASASSASIGNESNTFCRLLLIKCRDEFDNRLKATEKFREKLTFSNNSNNNNNGNNNNQSTGSGANNSGTHSQSNHKGGPRPILTNLSSLSSSGGNRSRIGGGGGGSSQHVPPASALPPAVAPRKLSDEEEEQWTIAKSKMLGNMRFICELGRQGLVQENILHVCITQLVSKRKEETISSKSEDLECLCQIMKTVGRLLDTDKARKLMAQYFERIIFYSGCQELPSRIRFMMKDVIELRETRWQPRRVQRENGPRPIGQIREEAAKDLGIDPMCFWDTASMLQSMTGRSAAAGGGYLNGGMMMMPGPPGSGGPYSQQRLPLYGHPALPLVMNQGQRALDDMGYYANFGSNSFLGTGPGAIREDRHGGGSGGGGNQRRNQNQSQSQDGMQNHGGGSRQGNSNGPAGGGSHVQGHMPYRGSSSQDDPRKRSAEQPGGGNRNNPSNQNRNVNQAGNLNLPPRMLSSAGGQKGGGGPAVNQMNPMSGGPQVTRILQPGATPVVKMPPIENISLRPAQNSMLLKPLGQPAHQQRTVSGKASPVNDQGVMANGKAVAAVNPKELLLTRCSEILGDLLSEKLTLKESMAKMRELKIQKNFQPDVLITLMTASFTRSDKDRELVMKLLNSMKNENLLSVGIFMKSCESLLQKIAKLEVDDPLIKTHMSEFIGTFVSGKILDLRQAYDLVGDKYPMFLLVLQHMNSIVGKQTLSNLLEASKINLMSILPQGDRNKEQLSDILEKRGLSFLMPLLRIELDLRKILKSKDSSNPAFVSKWIKENVDEGLTSTKGFIFVLFTCICRHIIQRSGDQGSAAAAVATTATTTPAAKTQAELEKEGIKSYHLILTSFTANKASLQLTALYALQSVCNELSFPKGLILRWFNNLYDQEIIDEEIFLKWKEDINDEYPGKGQALFQVNSWLIWLAETEADSDDEEEDDEDEDADSLSRK